MKITAAVTEALGAPLTIKELELDELRPDEVRVRLVASGVCHTDAVVRDGGIYGGKAVGTLIGPDDTLIEMVQA